MIPAVFKGAGFALIGLILTVIVAASETRAEESYEQGVAKEAVAFQQAMSACQAGKGKACSDAFFNACGVRRNWSTVAMVLCQDAMHRYWDTRLNAAYKDVIGRATGAMKKDLRDAQRKWVAYRDARCGIYRHFEGSMWRPVAVGCHADMTRRRVADLGEIATAGPLLPLAGFAWQRARSLKIDINCDGRMDRAVFGLQGTGTARRAGIGWVDGDAAGRAPEIIIKVPVNGQAQVALCGPPVSLESISLKPGGCPVLRVDDGMCDALFIHRDRKKAAWVVERN